MTTVPTTQPDQTIDTRKKQYYLNIVYVNCHGNRCRVNAFQSTGYHCTSCYDKLKKNQWRTLDSYDIVEHEPTIVNCEGDKCRLNNNTIYCESCFGERHNEDSDYDDKYDRLLVNRLYRC